MTQKRVFPVAAFICNYVYYFIIIYYRIIEFPSGPGPSLAPYYRCKSFLSVTAPRGHNQKGRSAMLSAKRTTGRIVISLSCFILLAAAFISAGCGSDKEDFRDDRGTFKVREELPESQVTDNSSIEEDSVMGPQYVEEITEEDEIDREVSYGEAEEAYFDGDYEEAVRLFEAYTGQKSENPWGYYMLGLSAWKAGNYQVAEESFQEALELDPGHIKSRINLSRVYLDTERAQLAADQLAVVLENEPESSTAHHLMGRVRRQMGETDEAVISYRRAIQLDNANVWAMNNLGLIYIREADFEMALQPLARAAAIRDDIPLFQNNLGMALENTGHYRQAENAYAAAVTMDKGYDRAYNNLCRVELLEEEPEAGEIDLASVGESFIRDINSQAEVAGEVAESEEAVASDSTISATVSNLITVADADTTNAN
ncbi:MAG: tetratricopeptide repeat protein [Candidatus Latescibacteria bacterium]|nr:tetratricopeptide repeat protein [bacterium]MBD3424958.1 tetratricopeptide repeat protein [Candidatus Latescibacterota bacterium]